MKIRAIITGATGMVGEGVLHECLQHAEVEHVLVISRKSVGITHPKLKEIIHANFLDLSAIENELQNYNACFFCLGVTSIAKKEPEYTRLTYDLTIHMAETLIKYNAAMTFCYVSGAGTDGTAQGKSMWARVKGKTENKLISMPFKKVFAFRPGYMHPTVGLKNTLKGYGAISWAYPFLRAVFPKHVSTLKEVALAMINTVNKDYPKSILEVKDIVELSRK